jgi:hypothetical protein
MSVPQTATISEIDAEKVESWEGKVFLTIDVDWASDEVIHETVEVIEAAGVKTTWFITHETPWIERLRRNPKIELGIHPNFNFLLAGDPRNGGTAEEVVDRLLAIVPEARAVRSHSMLQSTNLLALFREKGLTHDANTFVSEWAGIALKPWIDWLGMTRVPYCWEDDIYCLSAKATPIEAVADRPGLRVFDFHPIHIFLNTECISRYEAARSAFDDFVALSACRNKECVGARDLLQRLLDHVA